LSSSSLRISVLSSVLVIFVIPLLVEAALRRFLQTVVAGTPDRVHGSNWPL
jgi:hypothetical protein